MSLSARSIRTRLALMRPLLDSCALEPIRRGQNKVGELMEARYRGQVVVKHHGFEQFEGAWMIPHDERRQGVILYLHGGGFASGDLEYAKGFGATLAVKCGVKVFCAAYRLAPEAPFPAALEDALTAYRYLLDKGYAPSHITLCGESAGGGLCYSLCMKLRQLELAQPAGIIGLSPWTDLTASGTSYEENREKDPSISAKLLDFYAQCYTQDRRDPYVSPLFGDLTGLPPSLLFVGSDEIMRSDTEDLHKKLLESGCRSSLTVKKDRWHAYLVYTLAEDEDDFTSINTFLNARMAREDKLRWLRLDNAAKIYPAARRRSWSNVFRLSATLTETVDVAVLQSALDVTVRRFPSIATRLRRGVFWYYLQQISHAPTIMEENSFPLARMSKEETRRCAFRVIAYEKRVAVEIFHSLTDGNGALIFLKTLIAEYLQQKYGLQIPSEHGVLDRLEEPSEEEFEDSFLKYAGDVAASRRENDAWQLSGTLESDGFLHVTCFRMPVQKVLEKAKSYHVSLTTFLCAALMQALLELQEEQVPNRKRHKSIKVLIPVNLRRVFDSRTLRNFALYTTPEIDPKLGDYTFEEICKAVHHRMGLDINPKQMSMKIATNVNSEKIFIVKLMPLFIKNFVMKAVFDAVGERKSCLSLSNLGAIQLPEVMKPYITRMDFILGVQATAPSNCGVLSYGDTLYMNFIRNTTEPQLEAKFHQVLRSMGIPVKVESNHP